MQVNTSSPGLFEKSNRGPRAREEKGATQGKVSRNGSWAGAVHRKSRKKRGAENKAQSRK